AHPKERARIGSLYIASWFIGAIVTALSTFQMPNNWGWRIPFVLQILEGTWEEAYAILAKYHAEGDLAC
ncbi:hypothetical protein C8Q74DRAFT_1210417, partial [Fomes fomentarius]